MYRFGIIQLKQPFIPGIEFPFVFFWEQVVEMFPAVKGSFAWETETFINSYHLEVDFGQDFPHMTRHVLID